MKLSMEEKLALWLVKVKLGKERYMAMLQIIGRVLAWVEGHKTTFMAAGAIATEACFSFGFVTAEQRTTLLGIFGFGAVGTLGLKLNRLITVLKASGAVAHKDASSAARSLAEEAPRQ